MAYTISLHEEYGNVILEVLQNNNGKIKRNEFDNKRQIKEALDCLIPYIESPKFDKENDRMFANLPEEAKIVINDYSLLEKHKILTKTTKKIDELIAKQEAKKKIAATGLTLGILTMAITPQALTNIKSKAEQIGTQTNIENTIENTETVIENTIENYENIIEMKETPNEFLSGFDITLLDSSDLEFIENISIEKSKAEWVENYLTNYLNLEEIGRRKNDAEKTNVETNYQHIIEKYCTLAGIDSEIIKCILAQERGFHSNKIDEGGAIGIGQIQYNVHIDTIRSLKNFQTGEIIETFEITDKLLKDLEGNIKTSITIFIDNLIYYEGNVFLATQAYNYGIGAVDTCLENCEKRTGISKETYIKNPCLLDWIEDVHNFSETREAKTGYSYGDKNYLEQVYNHYGEAEITLKYEKDGPNYTISIAEAEKSQTR